jgi:hypothetical protein
MIIADLTFDPELILATRLTAKSVQWLLHLPLDSPAVVRLFLWLPFLDGVVMDAGRQPDHERKQRGRPNPLRNRA